MVGNIDNPKTKIYILYERIIEFNKQLTKINDYNLFRFKEQKFLEMSTTN